MRVATWRVALLALVASLGTIVRGNGDTAFEECAPYDVVLMLDADTSLETFEQIKSSAKAIGRQFNIGKKDNKDRVTAFSFGSSILVEKSLNNVPTTRSLIDHIDTMQIADIEKNMPFALDAVHAHFQEMERDATKVIVLLSDGHVDMNSWDSSLQRLCSSISGQDDLSEEAIQACFLEQVKHIVDDGGIQIVYVPVGDQPFVPEADTDELADYLKIPSDLSGPEVIAEGVANLVCDVTAAEFAENGVDIIFVVDATYTDSGKENDAIHFLQDFLSEDVFGTVPAGGVRFGSVVYSNVIVDEQTILNENGDPRFETDTMIFMEHLESVIRSSQSQSSRADLDTNTPLALKTAQSMIEATRDADTAASRNERLTYVVHVGDDKPFVRYADYASIPSDCDGHLDQSRYPQKVARSCTSKYAQAIQDTPATFIAARVGNRQANGLYDDVEPKVQQLTGKDAQDLDLANCIMTAECSTAPTDEPAPSPLEEYCTEIGGLYAGGLACCSSSCGTCGGGGCSGRPGGYPACCQSGVESSDRTCSDLVGPPCRMNAPTSAPTSPPTFLSVRMTLPGSDRVLSLCEVELLDQDMNRLPLFAAQQSSTAFGGDALRAIDGVSDTTWAGDSCTHTETENDPFWEALTSVDPQTIVTVRLTNRVESCAEGPCEARLAGVEVTVGGIPFFNVQIVPSFPTDGTTLEEVCTDIGGLYAGGFACCASSCGSCGGVGCSSRPGGTYACCQTAIEPSNRICSDLVGPPCRMEPIEAP